MRFNTLEGIKNKKFNNDFGIAAYIDKYVHYEGTEQISIHIKSGYGASEKMTNEVISEHDLQSFIEVFKKEKAKKIDYFATQKKSEHENIKPIPKEIIINKPIIHKPIENNIKMNTETKEETNTKDTENNHKSLRSILFETMVGVKNGNVDVQKSKAISAVAQTIINSFKAENEANKKLK